MCFSLINITIGGSGHGMRPVHWPWIHLWLQIKEFKEWINKNFSDDSGAIYNLHPRFFSPDLLYWLLMSMHLY